MSSTPTSYDEGASDAPVNPAHLREKLERVEKWLKTNVDWITTMNENPAAFTPENPVAFTPENSVAFTPENPVVSFFEDDTCDSPDRVQRLKTSLNKFRGVEQRAK